jgi:hypothetical protein
MKQIKDLKIKSEKHGYQITLTFTPKEQSLLQEFCENTVADYRDGYVITDVAKYEKVDAVFHNNLFVPVKGSEYYTFNPEYVAAKEKYRVRGSISNNDDYCITKVEDEENTYVFSEYFVNNAIVRACVVQLQAWYEDETHLNDCELIRLLCSLSFHWN